MYMNYPTDIPMDGRTIPRPNFSGKRNDITR